MPCKKVHFAEVLEQIRMYNPNEEYQHPKKEEFSDQDSDSEEFSDQDSDSEEFSDQDSDSEEYQEPEDCEECEYLLNALKHAFRYSDAEHSLSRMKNGIHLCDRYDS